MNPRPLGLALAALAVLAGCRGSRGSDVEPPPITARLATARKLDVPDRSTLYGTIEAERVAAVSSRVAGNVLAVRVRTGDRVAAGAVLVEIAAETPRGLESQARGALAQARAALSLAERNHARFSALAASGAASPLELDLARLQLDQAKGAVEQGRGALEAAAAVARESRVVSPFSGRVVARLVEAGDFAAPGRPLVTLESETGRRLVVAVSESLVAASGLAVGRTLPVSVDAHPGTRLGTVVEMSPGADPASHAWVAKLRLEDDTTPSGLAGRAWLDAGSRPAVVVPRPAVLAVGGLSMVVTRDAAGRARSRAVTLGAERDGSVEVLSGLAGHEEVLVGLASIPRDGTPVRPGTP